MARQSIKWNDNGNVIVRYVTRVCKLGQLSGAHALHGTHARILHHTTLWHWLSCAILLSIQSCQGVAVGARPRVHVHHQRGQDSLPVWVWICAASEPEGKEYTICAQHARLHALHWCSSLWLMALTRLYVLDCVANQRHWLPTSSHAHFWRVGWSGPRIQHLYLKTWKYFWSWVWSGGQVWAPVPLSCNHNS